MHWFEGMETWHQAEVDKNSEPSVLCFKDVYSLSGQRNCKRIITWKTETQCMKHIQGNLSHIHMAKQMWSICQMPEYRVPKEIRKWWQNMDDTWSTWDWYAWENPRYKWSSAGVLVLTRNAPPPIRIPALHLRGMCVKVPSWIGQFHLQFTAAVL